VGSLDVQRVGTYEGSTPLQELANRFLQFDVAWSPSDYGTTVEHQKLIRDAYRAELADVLPGEWFRSMLVLIRPGGNIPMHKDVPEGAGLTRCHLVLQTNDRCWNYHDGDWQQLELGGIYTVDLTREHASINFGEHMRVHLVADVVPASVPALAR
jgi:hypothetical protein